MPFRFSLATVLRLRTSIERNREIDLIAAQRAVNLLAQQITDIDHTLSALSDSAAATLRAGTRAADLHFQNACSESLRTFRKLVSQQLEHAVKIRDQRALAYRLARRDREILDTLCEQEFQHYRRAEARREQQATDELYLLRRHYASRG